MTKLSRITRDEPIPGIFRLSGETAVEGRIARFNSHLFRAGNRWIWVDPGPTHVQDELFAEVENIVGAWHDLELVIATCLEAEAVANLSAALQQAPNAAAMMTTETWGFVELMAAPVDRVLLAGRFRNGLRLEESGAELGIVLNPYLQFSGAFVVQDVATGVLFTGGL